MALPPTGVSTAGVSSMTKGVSGPRNPALEPSCMDSPFFSNVDVAVVK